MHKKQLSILLVVIIVILLAGVLYLRLAKNAAMENKEETFNSIKLEKPPFIKD